MPFGGEELTHQKAIGWVILNVKNTRHASAGLQRTDVYHDARGATPPEPKAVVRGGGDRSLAQLPRAPLPNLLPLYGWSGRVQRIDRAARAAPYVVLGDSRSASCKRGGPADPGSTDSANADDRGNGDHWKTRPRQRTRSEERGHGARPLCGHIRRRQEVRQFERQKQAL